MFLDNVSDADLRVVKLSRDMIERGNFTNNNFYNDPFSGGRRNIMDATISGLPQFMHYSFNSEIRGTVIMDYIKRRIKEHGVANFGDVTYRIDKDDRGERIRMKYNRSYNNPTDKYKSEPRCSIMGSTDLQFLGSYIWENFEYCKYDIDMQFIKNYLVQYCDHVLNALLKHYHTRMHDRSKMNHCHEVLIRQCSAAFFAILTARNMIYWNNNQDEMSFYIYPGKQNWHMAFPVEYLANVVNGTEIDYAGSCYTPSTQQRHYEGDVSVTKAIVGAITGRSASSSTVSQIEKTDSFMAGRTRQLEEEKLWSF